MAARTKKPVFRNIETKYAQIYRFLSEAIRNKQFEVGGKLPSEAELIGNFGVSRMTIRRALAELVKDGVVEKQHGIAHRVSADKPRPVIGLIYGNDLMVPDEVPAWRLLIKELDRILKVQQFNLRLYCIRSRGQAQSECERLIMDIRRNVLKGVVGMSWPPATCRSYSAADEPVADLMNANAVPLVALSEAKMPNVIVLDYERMGYLGTKYFLDEGIDRVALIMGEESHRPIPVLDGYEKALSEGKVRFRPQWVCSTTELSPRGGFAAMKRLWASHQKPRAVVVSDDFLAQGVMMAINELEIESPAELQMAAFNIKGSGLLYPRPFIQLQFDPKEVAEEIAGRLIQRIREPNVSFERYRLQPRVVPYQGFAEDPSEPALTRLHEPASRRVELLWVATL